ncbi:MAG: YkgJ family cysteine cluster protein, partial [Bacteroidota bacterium]
CANCCKKQTPGLSKEEAEQISRQLDMSFEDFRDQYLETSWMGDMMLKDQPCVFLKDNKCSIAHIMPEDCRSYPYLHKDAFISRLFGVIDNYSVCPIVFNVYEALKEELDFDPEDFDDFF